MKFTEQEHALIKLAAAHLAPQLLKKATLQGKLAEYGIGMSKKASEQKLSKQLQQKLASYGVGLTKKAETYSQAFARFAEKKFNDFGDWLNKSYRNALLNSGKTPAQVNPPSNAEWQKGREIYGSWDRGYTTPVWGTPLWEKTKYDIKRDARDRKSDMLWKARFNARINKLNQEGRQNYFAGTLGLAKGTTDPLTRDMYLRDINLLPPRNDDDKAMIDIMFPNK